MESALYYLTVALGISIVVNLILKRLGVSPIIGYIMTGTMVAYGFDLRHLVDSHTLEAIAEFGVVFLMFTIGLGSIVATTGDYENRSVFQRIFTNDPHGNRTFWNLLWVVWTQLLPHHSSWQCPSRSLQRPWYSRISKAPKR